MLTFLVKDLLLFWRDRKEVATVIVLPLVIVIVLSISMSGMFDDDQNLNYDLSLSVVMEDQQSEAIEAFRDAVAQSSQIPESDKQGLVAGVEAAPPVDLLMQFLNSPELADFLTVETMTRSEAAESVENGDRTSMLVIPDGYTEQLLNNIYLAGSTEPALEFSARETAMEVDIVHDVIQSFLDRMNLQYAIFASGGEIDMNQVQWPEGGTETLSEEQSFTINIDQYFTLSMGVLFVLFMASTVASRTGVEKREQTFNRITLANAPAYHFLFGKTIATFILAWLQIMLVFVGSHLILGVFSDRSFVFWAGLIFMATVFSLSIAGLSSIMTSISLRLKNPEAADGVFMGIIMLFGIIGGSFIPIYVLPGWIQQIGEFTPNGQTLAVLIEWLQSEDLSTLWLPSIILLVVTLVAVLASIMLYPKKGEVL